jgi:hypothetical protein
MPHSIQSRGSPKWAGGRWWLVVGGRKLNTIRHNEANTPKKIGADLSSFGTFCCWEGGEILANQPPVLLRSIAQHLLDSH